MAFAERVVDWKLVRGVDEEERILTIANACTKTTYLLNASVSADRKASATSPKYVVRSVPAR